MLSETREDPLDPRQQQLAATKLQSSFRGAKIRRQIREGEEALNEGLADLEVGVAHAVAPLVQSPSASRASPAKVSFHSPRGSLEPGGASSSARGSPLASGEVPPKPKLQKRGSSPARLADEMAGGLEVRTPLDAEAKLDATPPTHVRTRSKSLNQGQLLHVGKDVQRDYMGELSSRQRALKQRIEALKAKRNYGRPAEQRARGAEVRELQRELDGVAHEAGLLRRLQVTVGNGR